MCILCIIISDVLSDMRKWPSTSQTLHFNVSEHAEGIYTVGHKGGIFCSPQFHGIFLAVGDI